jgi:sugar phosphate isomerase/epimerase
MDLGLLHGPALDRDAVLSEPEVTAERIRNAGISASNVYWLFGDGLEERALSDAEARNANLKDLEAVLSFATALGCPTLFVLPGVSHPGQSTEISIGNSIAGLKDMVGLARDHDVTLTIEPHVGGLLDSPERTLDFIDRVPGLKLTLDYAHFACMGFPQPQIDPLAKHAAHIHLRQARPGVLQAKWGEGTLDFGAMIHTLRGVGYDGYLSLEYVHQSYMNTLSDDVLTETIQMRNHVLKFLSG